MNSDVRLDDPYSGWVQIRGSVIKAEAADLMLDSPARRGPGGGRWRRALVHGSATATKGDHVIVNFNGDYPGGVRVIGADLNLRRIDQRTSDPKLPKKAALGDLLFIRNQVPQFGVPHTSLWLCTGQLDITGDAEWSQVSLGQAVIGTEG